MGREQASGQSKPDIVNIENINILPWHSTLSVICRFIRSANGSWAVSFARTALRRLKRRMKVLLIDQLGASSQREDELKTDSASANAKNAVNSGGTDKPVGQSVKYYM